MSDEPRDPGAGSSGRTTHEGTTSTSADPDAARGASSPKKSRHTRWLYARVLIVQAVTLLALFLLQAVYGGG